MIALISLVFAGVLAHGEPWQALNKENFLPYFNDVSPKQNFAQRWDEINPWTLSLIYEFAFYNGYEIYVHSHVRPGHGNSRHQENHKSAVDVRFHLFDGFTRCQKFDFNVTVWEQIQEFALNFGYGDIKGLGIYYDVNNPFIHIDLRESDDDDGANWARVNGNYVTIEEGLEYYRNECP